MTNGKHSVDLTTQEIELIESALHTQEKILAVQSRAGTDNGAKSRLTELKSVLKSLRRQSPRRAVKPGKDRGNSWTDMALSLFI